ncbi:adenylate/guanylate cyclase domain-containing protein [Ruegeria arenilitoris]|uniref:adenylate/guanylate cyclase domain-containing protein n=1 Tax=Ruegeria arenilitoris TaxID=1173585 RepID=UPI00147B3569|nr:adenylate/guanylate cyclase domain-containing protein [Ruegeria arenilitoris]
MIEKLYGLPLCHDIVAGMNTHAKNLLLDAELGAERSIGYVRCAVGLSISFFFFVVVAPTLEQDNPALNVAPYFVFVSAGYFAIGCVTLYVVRSNSFRTWMTWLFTTMDIVFWWSLLVATVKIIDLPWSQIIIVPPVLLAFAILALVALRNNPKLQVFALIFVVMALISLYFLAADPITPQMDNALGTVGFFDTPLNIVRLLMVALTGGILFFLAVRTRALLNRAIEETTRRTKLAQFLPAQLAEQLSTAEQAELLKGKLQSAAVLFVDVRGFTAMSEGLAPGSLGEFLSTYRKIVTAQVHGHNGIIDKFIGDSVMAVFGAPDASADDAQNALKCSIAILESIDSWNAKRGRMSLKKVKVGIGIHAGEVFSGAVGDESRLEFTVLGDTVNVAARLEQATKEFGCRLVVSEVVLEKSGFDVDREEAWKPLGNYEVRGRAEKLAIFGCP